VSAADIASTENAINAIKAMREADLPAGGGVRPVIIGQTAGEILETAIRTLERGEWVILFDRHGRLHEDSAMYARLGIRPDVETVANWIIDLAMADEP
jgi:hypothetical protein